MTQPEQTINVTLSPDELRYVVSVGAALCQHVPQGSLPTYCHFSKQQIIDFSQKMRRTLDDAGLDM